MTDLLKRNLAPLTDAAWKAIEAQAERTLKGNLSARGMVDFKGPHGWMLAAVNTGRLTAAEKEAGKGVNWGMREALPLVEVRVPFAVNIWEMDNIERGELDPDLDDLIASARKAAIFEETAVYKGFGAGKIQGILERAAHKPVASSLKPEGMIVALETAVVVLQKAGIGGPYGLALGTAAYQALKGGDVNGCPAFKRAEEIVRGAVHWSPALEGAGVLVSRRGGDFEFTSGQDLSIGYAGHDTQTVKLYFTESFTFRVLEPLAAVGLDFK